MKKKYNHLSIDAINPYMFEYKQKTDYLKAIQPFIDLKTKIYENSISKIINSNGIIVHYFNNNTQKTLDIIDEYIHKIYYELFGSIEGD